MARALHGLPMLITEPSAVSYLIHIGMYLDTRTNRLEKRRWRRRNLRTKLQARPRECALFQMFSIHFANSMALLRPIWFVRLESWTETRPRLHEAKVANRRTCVSSSSITVTWASFESGVISSCNSSSSPDSEFVPVFLTNVFQFSTSMASRRPVPKE